MSQEEHEQQHKTENAEYKAELLRLAKSCPCFPDDDSRNAYHELAFAISAVHDSVQVTYDPTIAVTDEDSNEEIETGHAFLARLSPTGYEDDAFCLDGKENPAIQLAECLENAIGEFAEAARRLRKLAWDQQPPTSTKG